MRHVCLNCPTRWSLITRLRLKSPPAGRYVQTRGTPLHGKRVSVDRLVWAVGALAEGLGIRAVARVFGRVPEPCG